MNFVSIVFELGDKMLTLSSMENLIVQCNPLASSPYILEKYLFPRNGLNFAIDPFSYWSV